MVAILISMVVSFMQVLIKARAALQAGRRVRAANQRNT
jgi:hypothetical protein